jgi:DNA processing protein
MKASIYTGPEDLAQALHWTKPGEVRTINPAPDFSEREDSEKAILTHLQVQGPSEIDQLAYATALPLGTLASKLLALEFEGIVKSLPGKKFKLLG